jgi:uncharacterized protein
MQTVFFPDHIANHGPYLQFNLTEMKRYIFLILGIAFICGAFESCNNSSTYKTLLITGQGRSDWKASSEAIKQILDETGLFSTVIYNYPEQGEDASKLLAEFSKYKLVVIDFNGDKWLTANSRAVMDYVTAGGGLVFCDSKIDPAYGTSDSVSVSERHNFEIRMKQMSHPITDGLPARWLHASDNIIQGVKVDTEGSQVLATAFSDTAFAGSGKNEPVMIIRNTGKGRIFASLIGAPGGDGDPALHCTGFIVTLQRGAEWAASGKVTQEIPFDFPTVAGVVTRSGFNTITPDEAFGKIGTYDIGKSTKYYTCIQNSLRKAAGDAGKLAGLEKKMVSVLKDPNATTESKKLMLRELSWMGTEYCIPVVKELVNVPELKDEADFALTRLNPLK